MKKIFYFIASAIVALGAVACQNDINENIDNNQQTEGYSIKVTIDEQTRIALGEADANNKRKLTFTEEDVLVVRSADQEGTNYLFEYAKTEGDVYTFTCNTEGVNSLVGTTPHIFYLGGLHESADALIPYGVGVCNTAAETISGIGMYANASCHSSTFGDEKNTVTLFAHPILKFTANEPVTFSTKDETTFLFFVDGSWSKEYTTQTTGEIYLPILASNEQEIEVTVTTESGFDKTLTMEFEENMIYNLGTIEKPAKFYVVNNGNWSSLHLYAWDAGDNKLLGTWPGTAMTQEGTSNRYYVEIPAEYVGKTFNYIVNGGGNQTGDLIVANFTDGYTYEIPGVADPKPETVSIYLKTTWGWTDWSLFAWGGSGSWGDFNTWPGKAMEYTATIGGVVYKAWDIPTSCVGQSGIQVIVAGKEGGNLKQTKDTPVDVSKDVFVEISSWDGTANKATLTVITSPY